MREQDLVFDTVARYFALLSEPTRLRILHAVCDGERSTREIVAATGASPSSVAHHLQLMHERGALARRQHGGRLVYRVADQALTAMCRNVCQRVSEARGAGAPGSVTDDAAARAPSLDSAGLPDAGRQRSSDTPPALASHG